MQKSVKPKNKLKFIKKCFQNLTLKTTKFIFWIMIKNFKLVPSFLPIMLVK